MSFRFIPKQDIKGTNLVKGIHFEGLGLMGIPKKNIAPLAGKPLIAWVIETALASKIISRVIVDTDSEEIAVVAREQGT